MIAVLSSPPVVASLPAVSCRGGASLWVIFLLWLAGQSLSVPVQAAFMTGEVLREYCDADDRVLKHKATENDIHDSMACLSYIAGVHDSMRGMLFCTPDRFDNGEATETTKQFIRSHPEKLKEPASRIIIEALSAKFPCAGGHSG